MTIPHVSTNISWHHAKVTADDRRRVLGQSGCVLWLTGLSGSGKSTIARALEYALLQKGRAAYVLDGDNIRHGLSADLDFSPQSRTENIRRVAEVAALLSDAGLFVITAFISPYSEDRKRARAIVNRAEGMMEEPSLNRFHEVYINTPLDVCEARDPKALYAKARAGLLPEFTGISAPFEEPASPDLELRTAVAPVDCCVRRIIEHLEKNGYLGKTIDA